MNIQLFAEFDNLINSYNEEIKKTNNEMSNMAIEKNTLLNTYNQNYQNQLNEYENLNAQEQNYIDTWANTQKELQQQQTDYNLGILNQQKQDAQKQVDSELGQAYIDYQKGLNQYAGNAETMASNGLTGTGFAKNSEIAMNITYQNRVSTAKSALMKANTEYDNLMEQARLNNNSALAEIALQQMEKSYELALEGFNYKNTLFNNKLAYEQNLSDTYFGRQQSLQNQINNYRSQISSITEAQADLKERQRQFNANLAEEQRQFNAQLKASNYNYSDNNTTNNNTNNNNNNSNSNNNNNNKVQETPKNNKTYSAMSSPYTFSSTKARDWYLKNISGKKFTEEGLVEILTKGYNNKTLSSDDVQRILKTYGLE